MHLLKNMITVPQLTAWPFAVSMLLERKNNLGVSVSQRNMEQSRSSSARQLLLQKGCVRTPPGWAGPSTWDLVCTGGNCLFPIVWDPISCSFNTGWFYNSQSKGDEGRKEEVGAQKFYWVLKHLHQSL